MTQALKMAGIGGPAVLIANFIIENGKPASTAVPAK